MFETGTADNYTHLLELFDTFLVTNGSAFGLTYAGTGTGTFTAYKGGTASVAETFTIAATSATNFTVTGTVSGALAAATVGTPYTGTKIQFTLTAGGTAFIAGDTFTISTAPKYVNKRKCRGCAITASQGATGTFAIENILDGKATAAGGTGLEQYNDFRQDSATFPLDVQMDFYVAETIVEYAINPGNLQAGPNAWTLDYWTGSAWTTLDTRSAQTSWSSGEFRAFTIASPVSATRYRLHVTAGTSTRLDLGAIQMRRASGGIDASFSQYIWEAPGNDGDSQIYCGVHHFRRVDTDYFNWEVASFDAYNASARFYGQAGFHGQCYLPLWADPIPYWFICDGRHAIVIAKVNTQYELAYFGFIDPYFTPAQLPYPAALGATLAPADTQGRRLIQWNDAKWRWSNSTREHRMPTHSDAGGTYYANRCQMRARKLDGVWQGFVSASDDDLTTEPQDTFGRIWPYNGDFSLLDPSWIPGATGTPAHDLFPVRLNAPGPNTLGQLSGIAALTGQDVSAESLVKPWKSVVEWLVIPNITRTDRNDYLAVALD